MRVRMHLCTSYASLDPPRPLHPERDARLADFRVLANLRFQHTCLHAMHVQHQTHITT